MKSTLKKVIPLALILIGLGALATWDEWKTKQEEKQKTEENQLFKFDVASVQSFEYTTNGKVNETSSGDKKEPAKVETPFTATFTKQDGKWRISAPFTANADTVNVDNLLKAVGEYKYDKVISESKADWDKFGLSKPSRSLKITLSGQQPVSVFVGMNAPVGYSTYVATSKDDRVLIGGQHITTSLTKTLLELRDKSFVEIPNDITRFTYQKEKTPALEFGRTDGKFQIEKPEVFDTDSSNVTSFIEDLKALRVAEFVDKPDKALQDRFSDKFLNATVSWTDAKGASKKLFFTYNNNEMYASFDPKVQIFKLAPDAKGKLTKVANDFRNKKVFAFVGAKAIALEADGKNYKKVKEGWYSVEDAAKFNAKGEFSGKKEDEPKQKINARTLLVDLEYARGEDFIKLSDPIAASLNSAPQHRVVIVFAPDSGAKPLTIEGWVDPKNPEKILVKHSEGKYIYRVAKTLFSSASEEKAPTPNAKSEKSSLQDVLNSNDPG